MMGPHTGTDILEPSRLGPSTRALPGRGSRYRPSTEALNGGPRTGPFNGSLGQGSMTCPEASTEWRLSRLGPRGPLTGALDWGLRQASSTPASYTGTLDRGLRLRPSKRGLCGVPDTGPSTGGRLGPRLGPQDASSYWGLDWDLRQGPSTGALYWDLHWALCGVSIPTPQRRPWHGSLGRVPGTGPDDGSRGLSRVASTGAYTSFHPALCSALCALAAS
ncbi:hypothetical protein M885DRAFT_292026 [Pelagophyceae sp. CCMP2097]|nr:hypothetical protein M885DRAFT_292026 [Pelagophyceae sp. CCMP2097]